MMKNRYLLLLLLALPVNLVAQTDTLFWFAVPYATPLHTTLTADLTLTATDETNITTVVISQPYNPAFSPITVTIDPGVSLTKTVSFTQAQLLLFSNNLYNTKSNSALLIRSDREITAYYEINKLLNNPAIFTLKGKNALGYDFWTPFQNHWENHTFSSSDPAFSQIVIVATENNTKVTINFKTAAFGYAANTNYDIYLDKGQTYMFVPRLIGGVPSVLTADRLIGTHITTSPGKPIAVTLGDDSVEKGGYDFMGDQHIPVKNVQNKAVIGHDYIVMRGKVSDGNNGERVYILTTEATNNIKVTHKNGTVTTYTPANAGEQISFTLPAASNDHWAHIYSDKPIYVLHVAGFGSELGETILPTIDGCTGSLSVSFVRSKDYIGSDYQPFYLNLMTKIDAIDSFYISIDGGPAVPFLNASNFEQAGTSDWYVLKDVDKLIDNITIPAHKVTRITNTKNVFQLGYFNGVSSGGGCVYGYFSDYNELEASATVADQGNYYIVCGVDSVELKAKGGLSYKWSPTEYLDDPNVQNPILRPPHDGFSQLFTVKIEQPCSGDTIMHVFVDIPKSPTAFMTVNQNNGCAPLSVNMKDASTIGSKYVLDLGDGSPLIESTTPISLLYNYQNTSNAIIDYIISYTVGNLEGCYDYYVDTMAVFPQVTSDFELVDWNDTTICNATTVDLKSTSTGNTDTFQWDFGDGSSDNDPLVSHTYQNHGANDTLYHVQLIANSPFGCHDTSDMVDIRVYPYIYSSYTVDSARICSPASLFINPTVSVGVDTFHWSLSDINKAFLNSTFLKLNETPFAFNHNNTTRPVPDTILIEMNAVNRFGCTDTAITRTVIVYPLVDADFGIDDNAICDSVGVLITNNSSGFNLVYEWDFGNGTSVVNSSPLPFTRYFLNRSDHDTTYTVKLITSSDYFCTDTANIPLTVYPYVNASFAIDYSNNCSPLNVQVANNSIGGSEYNWDFGDGDLATTYIPNTFYHIYENDTDHDTIFHIWLRTVNASGCADSLKRSVSLFSQVVADFNFSGPSQGCNPLNVSYVNNSKGANLIYNWDFGDKTYSGSQNPPPRLYQNSTAKDTTYYVNLTVMNLAGCDSSITHPVEVFSKVTADFSIERLDSCSPFKIKVNNLSSGGITDFIWKYTSADQITLYDFSDPDIPVYRNQTLLPIKYPFVLTTQNSHGCSANRSDTVTVFPEVHADFHPDLTAGCQPLPVGFVNNTNIMSGTSFFWDFDDGRYSNAAAPPDHIFKNITNTSVLHNILLEATTQYGCFDDTTISVEVYPYIYAKFTLDRPEICSHELFTFDRSSSSGAIDHYYWDYEDDGTEDEDKTTPIFNHTYHNTGITNLNPNIRLRVTNAQGCDTSWTESIIVHPQVRAAFDIDTNQVCYPMASVFTNQSEPGVPLTYYWDFGDGSSSTASDPQHAFKNFSRTNDVSFTINLTATSEYACDSTISGTVTIHPKPLADFSFPLAVDCPPFAVPFTNNSQGLSLDYYWDFDNGTTSTATDPGQTFHNTGSLILEKNISLMATTDFACSDTSIKPISIYPGVEVDFTANDWSGCNPLTVNFDGTATNENEYYWYVDNKVFSNYQDPSYRFVNESMANKVFSVVFKAVSLDGCTADTAQQLTVYPQPHAEFLPDPQAQEFNTATDITSVTINNMTNSQPIWEYHWDFGDGTNSAVSTPSFSKNYTIWGDITNENRIPVSLVANNKNNPECSDTIMHYVIIAPPLPKVNLGADISGCMPLTVDFPSATKYNYTNGYQWDFGFENNTSTIAEPSPLVYDTAGVYIIRLVVQGDGGYNYDYKKVTVYPKPMVDFSFTPDYAWLRSQTEDGIPIKFFNTTPQGENFSFLWEFGDGETSSEFQPMHEYMAVGTFYTTLIAESGEGCLDTLTHESPVVIDGRGRLDFPNVITIVPGEPAEEVYNAGVADPRIFRPVSEGVEKYKLEIYNRWGELIFTSEDINKGWNGFIKGSPAKQDVYVWRVTATFTNGSPYVKAGDVTLLVRQP